MLFLGDSITYAGLYIIYIETYLRFQYPGEAFSIINCGLSSETVSGLSEQNHAGGAFARPDLHERLERVLTKTHPDVVIACYGMNDGIYQPLDQEHFAAFQTGMRKLHDLVIQQGAKIIHLTPPPFDDVDGRHPYYEAVIAQEAQWLMSQNTEGWVVFDIHSPMNAYLSDYKKEDPDFRLAPDGVHPDPLGHWLIAREILRNLGFPEITDIGNFDSLTEQYEQRTHILNLIKQKHELLRDAWLTATGHSRPDVRSGIPLIEAQELDRNIETTIHHLLCSEFQAYSKQ